MPSNSCDEHNPELLRPVRLDAEPKQLRKVQARLKDLRIRYLARKFLRIWMNRTVGRVLPQQARNHYGYGVLRRAFARWRDEWWKSKRECCLIMRAENHYRYSLLYQTLHKWIYFISLQRENRTKMQRAYSLAEVNQDFSHHLVRKCWNKRRDILSFKQATRHVAIKHNQEMVTESQKLTVCSKAWLERLEEAEDQGFQPLAIMARTYNRVFLLKFYFCHWRQKHAEKKHMEAILHEGRFCAQEGLLQRSPYFRQHINGAEKQEASHRLYVHKLLHKPLMQYKDSSIEIQDRKIRKQQACRHGDLHGTRDAADGWKKFAQKQRVSKSQLKEMQGSFVVWKKHHKQIDHKHEHVEELYSQQTLCPLRNAVTERREKTSLQVFMGWREATAHAMSKRHQQREALNQAQWTISQGLLLRSFRHWRKHASELQIQRMNMEKASRHHESKLLSKALKAWRNDHCQHRKNKVMKRQGLLLLRLKMYQKFFKLWTIKFQHRRREVMQTEQALWHWSLTLQAKVFYGWKLWASEQQSRREEASRVVQVYRDGLLREGVMCILTYAAHMSDITTSLVQFSQEQRSRRLQRLVRRCAMRWKQRALGKSQTKTMTSCLPEVLPSDSAEKEDGAGVKQTQEHFYTSSIVDHPPKTNFTSAGGTSEPHTPVADSVRAQNQDLLLPPSAFMSSRAQKILGNPSSTGQEEPTSGPFFQAALSSENGPADSSDSDLKASSNRDEEDEASGVMGELLSIQLDMKSFQQRRKQLRTWMKLRDVLQSWLKTSAEDETETDTVSEELKELEQRIGRLSTELETQKPMMLRHVKRIQHLQSEITALGLYADP